MVPFRNRWIQVGVVSFGTGVGYQPSEFARAGAGRLGAGVRARGDVRVGHGGLK